MRCGAPLASGRDPQAPEPQLDHDVESTLPARPCLTYIGTECSLWVYDFSRNDADHDDTGPVRARCSLACLPVRMQDAWCSRLSKT